MDSDLHSSNLAKYLNHHHSGAIAGCRLAERLAQTSSTLSELGEAVRHSRHALERIMDALGAWTVFHRATAWISELMAGVTYSDRMRKRSPLGLLQELETMALGIEGQRRLWVSLQAIARDNPRLDEAHLAELVEGADEQLDLVETARIEAARTAFSRS